MNKVISINIGGSIFQIEENAFETLNSYLNELKKHFSNKAEGNEIITDIENRIAELLRNKINSMKAAINLDDVNEVTTSMGAPKDFANEEEEETSSANSTAQEKKQNTSVNSDESHNRVYRDPDGRIIGGVCSGLGHYFKIDPVWIRLFFVIVALTSLRLIFFGASPVLIYIILWIVIPEAKTTAEKLQMRKEKINIDNIQKSVQTEFDKVKDAVQNPKFQQQATTALRRIFDLIRQLVLGVLNIIRMLGKFFLYFLSVIFFIVAIGSLAGRVNYDNHNGFNGINVFHFFENNSDKITAHAAFFAGFTVMGFIVLLLANSLSRNKFNGKTNLALRTTTILLSVIAIVLIIISGMKVTSYFLTSDKIENVIPLDSAQHHFYIRSIHTHFDNSFPFFLRNDTLRINDVDVSVEPTDGPSQILAITKSYGQNQETARLNASGIIALLSVQDSIISIPESFTLSNNQVYRKQELRYKIKLHTGSKLTVDENYWRSLKLKQNNDFRRASSGNTYDITATGADCIDCSKSYSSGTVNMSGYPLSIPLRGHEFKKVIVSSDINVKIVKGDHFLMKARGTNDEDHLNIDFENNTVKISDNRRWRFNLLNDLNSIELIIVMPEISQLQISGVVQARLDGFDEEELKIDMSGTSTCMANIRSGKLIIEQTGATKLTLDGKFDNCEASVSGASKLYASSASMKSVEIEASGASYAEVSADEKLDADASGASNIRYKGNVNDVRSKNSGASSVEKMR